LGIEILCAAPCSSTRSTAIVMASQVSSSAVLMFELFAMSFVALLVQLEEVHTRRTGCVRIAAAWLLPRVSGAVSGVFATHRAGHEGRAEQS
jgi:hypothetical protein